jgi:hypothetical protein
MAGLLVANRLFDRAPSNICNCCKAIYLFIYSICKGRITLKRKNVQFRMDWKVPTPLAYPVLRWCGEGLGV